MTINTENNKSICKYPWDHSYIGSQYERKLCCISDDLVSEEKTETKDFWNSAVMKDVRKKMLAGEKIDACSVCYKNEEQNIESLRQQSWKSPCSEEEMISEVISKTNEDGSTVELPTYFDYRTIHCNLQCISCGSLYSSKHASLFSEMWNIRPKMFPSGKEFVIDYKFEDSMAEEIIECLDKRRLTKIYWAGGEPMMSGVHWKVVDKLLEIQSIDPTYIFSIFIHYNTNLTRLHWKGKIIPELLEFYQPSIQASLDGTHETFEFCRDGASWETVSTNWKEYHSRLNKRNQFGLSSIMSAPVLMDIDRWFEFYEPYDPELHSHKLFNHINRKTQQGFLDIRLYPQHIFDRIVDHAIKRFEECSLRGKERTIAILKSYKLDKSNNPIYSDPEMLKLMKKNWQYREKFLLGKHTFESLTAIIDPEVRDWYLSI
jgi:organic radical activating enzyme